MMSDVNAQIADRRRQWAQLTPQQQMQRVQFALLDFQNYVFLRRQQSRRRTAMRLAAQPTRVREYGRL
jgi:hypothetical protein